MKHLVKKIGFILCIILLNSIIVFCQQTDNPISKGNYLGQREPGITPELFAPELMNAEHGYHSTIVFSPDMSEAFWGPMVRSAYIMHSKLINGIWSAPEEVTFGLERGAGDPAFSPNGEKLFFQSFQPRKPGDAERERIWYVVQTPNGWSKPRTIDDIILKHPSHWTFSFAANGNLYFTSEIRGVRGEQDIYLARFDGNKYSEPVDLGEMINTDGREFAPCIAADESFVVFTRVGADTKKADLYVSFKKSDGSWTKAIDMGESINTANNDLCASLTPDGKYLFFLNQREGRNRMFWVSTKIIYELKPKDL